MSDTSIMKPQMEDIATGVGNIISQTAQYRNKQNTIGYSFDFFTNEMVKKMK